jgi:hypothetical protein
MQYMKQLFLLLAASLLLQPACAQFKPLAESAAFDEPEAGHARLILLRNGYTAFLFIHPKEGITLKIYDGEHHLRVEKEINSKFSDSKYKVIEAVFEIGSDIVLFTSQADEKTPVLYRMIIDGKTGNLKNDEKIAELNKTGRYKVLRLAFQGRQLPDFFIRKDPASDHYAIAKFNNFDDDPSRRLEIIYYGPDNREMGRAFYHSPEDRYENLRYIDMVVIGDQKVSVLAYAYNKVKHDRDGELVIASLEPGSQSVSLHELDFTRDLVVDGGITRYNPVSQSIILLAACRSEKKSNEYGTVIAFVNPFEQRVTNLFVAYPEKADAKSTELFGRKDHYTGMPQNLFVDNDGSFSIVFEEIANYSSSSGGSYSELGHLAVMQFNPNGKETGCYFIPKSQLYYKYMVQPFYHSEREGSAQRLDAGNQYKSFAYLHGKYKSYILFNDIEKNGETVEKGKITRIQGVGDCDGFYFLLGGSEVLVPRRYVFGKPDRGRDHNLAIFTLSDYDRDRNIYCTLKLEKEGRSKQVKLIWLEPQ